MTLLLFIFSCRFFLLCDGDNELKAIRKTSLMLVILKIYEDLKELQDVVSL